MNKKRLLIFSSLEGALGHYMAHLVPSLEKQVDVSVIAYKYGHQGDLIKPDPLVKKYIKDCHFLIGFEKWDEILTSLQEISDFVSKKKIDWINVQITDHARKIFYIYFSLFNILPKNIPWVFNFHDVLPQQGYPEYPASDDLLKKFYRLSQFALVGTREERERLSRQFDYSPSKISIVPHGIFTKLDFEKFSKESARKHLCIPEDSKVVLFFGFLRPNKGLDTLIEAFPAVLKEEPRAFLYISTATWFAKDKKSNLDRIKKLGLSSRVKFEDQFVKTKEIEPIFKASDIVTLPYKRISQSGILKLAMAFGKPTVVSSVVEEAKQIDGRFGISIPPSNPKILGSSIIKLLSNPNKTEEMGKASKIFAEREYSWDKIANAMLSAFQSAGRK